MISRYILIILTLGFLSSCKVPGVAIDPLQISQTQQSTNLEDIKRGVVIFRGISCPKGIEDNIEEESFITNLLKRTKMFFSSKCRGYKFVNDQYPNYYIRQFSDTASHKTFSNSKYYFYTVVPGKYYYEFSQNHDLSDKEMKKAFYFKVKQGEAVYVGDFIYDKALQKFRVIDNYKVMQSKLNGEIPYSIVNRIAKGSKVIK